MAGLGGFCPLPLRLGGDGWSAEDHARACADLLAMARSVPVWRMRLLRTGGAISVEAYRGVNGSAIADAPTTTGVSATHINTEFAYTDHNGQPQTIAADFVHVARGNDVNVSQPTVQTYYDTSRRQFLVSGVDDGGIVELTAFGTASALATGISHYGGALDKEDCQTEVVPYAWSCYRALQDARGSAYTRERGTIVHAENLCMARLHAGRWRDAERMSCESNPATASQHAEDWRKVLGVRLRPGDTAETIRTRNAAKMKAAVGPVGSAVDDAIASLLGTVYVRTWRNYDTETIADASGTFWPTVNPGADTRDLGGGPWYSDRQHLFVELQRSASVGDLEFYGKVDELNELLDRMLPATCTFDWGTGADDGFTLDEDLLDEGCLG